MTRRGKYPPEIREEAVRLVRAHRDQYESEWAAMTSVAGEFGATAETARIPPAELEANYYAARGQLQLAGLN